MPKKILIVDDNELMIEIMTYILINRGYDVMALYNGDEVIDHIKTNQPDLVILDMMLPAGVDGRDICKSIKLNKETRDLPVILCSGDDDVDQSIRQLGPPNDVLHKPFDINSLIQKVEFQLAA
jgi:DNA-binding response OmpR family regulator